MRAQRLLLFLPLLLVATGCSGQEGPGPSSSQSSSSSSSSAVSPTPAASESPMQLTATETCEQLAGNRGGLALDVLDFSVDFYMEDLVMSDRDRRVAGLVEQGDQLRAVAHPKYHDTLDRLMAEPEEIQRIVKSGGGRYTMPMQDIVQSVTGAATDCYQPGEELNRFVENMTPIINRIPEYAALEVDGASEGASSTPAASSTSTPTAGSAPASEPTPTPEPTPTLSEETEAAAEHEAGDVPMEYQSALRKAYSYEENMDMSKMGIYGQLVSEYGEQFSPEAAQYAIDNMTDVDWNANALAKAKSYQEMMDMSPSAIYDQLVSEYGEEFTPDQAQYAIDNLSQ